MSKKASILFFLLLSFFSLLSKAQDIALLLKEAQQNEARFNDKESLRKYLEILKIQPANMTALCKSSELYALLGKRQPTQEKQSDYYQMAKSAADKALRINPRSADANFVMAFAIGRIAIISSGEDKMKAVKQVRSYAEKCIQLDPVNYKAYHILGKWHYEVSDLNTVEKWLLKMVYGSLPKSSLELAIRNYEKSRQINPGFLLNYLELAKSYERKGDDRKAIQFLDAMMKLPLSSSNDATIKAQGKKMLEKLR